MSALSQSQSIQAEKESQSAVGLHGPGVLPTSVHEAELRDGVSSSHEHVHRLASDKDVERLLHHALLGQVLDHYRLPENSTREGIETPSDGSVVG